MLLLWVKDIRLVSGGSQIEPLPILIISRTATRVIVVVFSSLAKNGWAKLRLVPIKDLVPLPLQSPSPSLLSHFPPLSFKCCPRKFMDSIWNFFVEKLFYSKCQPVGTLKEPANKFVWIIQTKSDRYSTNRNSDWCSIYQNQSLQSYFAVRELKRFHRWNSC